MSANMKVFPDKEKYHDVLRNDFVNGKRSSFCKVFKCASLSFLDFLF